MRHQPKPEKAFAKVKYGLLQREICPVSKDTRASIQRIHVPQFKGYTCLNFKGDTCLNSKEIRASIQRIHVPQFQRRYVPQFQRRYVPQFKGDTCLNFKGYTCLNTISCNISQRHIFLGLESNSRLYDFSEWRRIICRVKF